MYVYFTVSRWYMGYRNVHKLERLFLNPERNSVFFSGKSVKICDEMHPRFWNHLTTKQTCTQNNHPEERCIIVNMMLKKSFRKFTFSLNFS